ncbi:MAG: Holliday junction branch migration protein RuvA [Cellulosilyticaceae bacterium]
MLAYLNGKITEAYNQYIVLEVMGVGYEIFMAGRDMNYAVSLDGLTKIYVYEHIKEDAHDLYGFPTKEEKNLFKKLISVSGIGPKGAAQILNLYSPNEVINFIIAGDSKALTKVSGIGPKTAQRVILELKDSMNKIYEVITELPIMAANETDYKTDAIAALISLGYASQDATKAVNAIFDYEDTTEMIIKKALNLLMI